MTWQAEFAAWWQRYGLAQRLRHPATAPDHKRAKALWRRVAEGKRK